MEEKSVFENFELEIGKEIKGHLKEISSWAFFLSIVGFIGVALVIILGMYIIVEYSESNIYYNSGLEYYGLVYIVLGVLYFFPALYSLKFSRKMKKALQGQDNNAFIEAFSNLKNHYKFVGILTIVIISIYIILFIIGFMRAL